MSPRRSLLKSSCNSTSYNILRALLSRQLSQQLLVLGTLIKPFCLPDQQVTVGLISQFNIFLLPTELSLAKSNKIRGSGKEVALMEGYEELTVNS